METQFDLLLGLGQDTLFACGTGYMVAWRGMGDIPSLEEREQPRPVKVGEGVLQGDMARGSGLSFPWRELEACNKARTCVCPSPVVKEVFFPFFLPQAVGLTCALGAAGFRCPSSSNVELSFLRREISGSMGLPALAATRLL